MSQCTPKTTAIRRAAVRETGVSRYQGGPIEGPPETSRTSQHYRIEGIKGVPDLGFKKKSIVFSAHSVHVVSLPPRGATAWRTYSKSFSANI